MKPVAILLLGFALRVAIMATNPVIWGGDTMIRLFDRHDVFSAHQLPLLQLLISGVSLLSMDPVWIRLLVAAIGAMAGVAFYWLAGDLFGPKWAMPAALLFVTHPYLLAVSTVPFQEILMLAALLMAFHFFYAERWLPASLFLAAACFTRYESWIACPVFAAAYVWRRGCGLAPALRSATLFGWAPAFWVLAHHGLTSPGHFVLDSYVSFWRLQRYVYLGWITAKFTQPPVLALAAAGFRLLLAGRRELDWRLWMQIAFVALFAIAILFSAHGVMPDPERYVTSREAHIPMYFVLIAAVLGLRQWPRANRAFVAASAVIGVAGAFWYASFESSRPDVQLGYRVAKLLDQSLRPGERALILACPVSERDARLYLSKAEQIGGEEGLRQAQIELRRFEATPPDYQRVVVHSRLGRDRLLASPAGCAEWIVVWQDCPGGTGAAAGAAPVEVLRAGSRSVSVFRRQCARQ
jgi:hypothetical protein